MADGETVSTLLGRIDRGWSGLWAHIEGLGDDQLERRSTNYEGWSLRIVLGHIARWEDWHRDAVEQHLHDGSVKSYEGFDRWNDEWAAEDDALSASEARNRISRSHERFRTLLGGLGPEEWDDNVVAWTKTCTYAHYEEHAGDFAARR